MKKRKLKSIDRMDDFGMGLVMSATRTWSNDGCGPAGNDQSERSVEEEEGGVGYGWGDCKNELVDYCGGGNGGDDAAETDDPQQQYAGGHGEGDGYEEGCSEETYPAPPSLPHSVMTTGLITIA